MKAAIVDTDTISYFFRGNADVAAKLDEYLLEHGRVYLSVVTYYEVLNGLYFKDAKNQLAQFERFVNLNEILPLTNEIAKKGQPKYTRICERKGKPSGIMTCLSQAPPSSTT